PRMLCSVFSCFFFQFHCCFFFPFSTLFRSVSIRRCRPYVRGSRTCKKVVSPGCNRKGTCLVEDEILRAALAELRGDSRRVFVFIASLKTSAVDASRHRPRGFRADWPYLCVR